MPGIKASEDERKEQLLAAARQVAVTEGLDRLTIRRVAGAAGLSHGLVHFHFDSKERLLLALLDRLLEQTSAFEVGPDIATKDSPLQRLHALLSQEMRRLSADRESIQLFFDFWLMGTRHRAVRRRMVTELKRYREAFRPMVDEVLGAEPGRFSGVTSDGLCAAVVAIIKGSAVQAFIDPRAFREDQVTVAVTSLLAPRDQR